MKELEVYAENTRSLLLYMNLHLLRIDNPDALTAASHLGRCLGICDVIKKIPFYLAKHRSYIPTDILLKVRHQLTLSIFLAQLVLWQDLGLASWRHRCWRIFRRHPRVCIYPISLYWFRVSAYAKKHLEVGREYKEKLPKNTHRAFLMAVEAEQFLNDLEKYNFDIFNEHFRKKYYLKVPFKMMRAAKSSNYWHTKK